MFNIYFHFIGLKMKYWANFLMKKKTCFFLLFSGLGLWFSSREEERSTLIAIPSRKRKKFQIAKFMIAIKTDFLKIDLLRLIWWKKYMFFSTVTFLKYLIFTIILEVLVYPFLTFELDVIRSNHLSLILILFTSHFTEYTGSLYYSTLYWNCTLERSIPIASPRSALKNFFWRNFSKTGFYCKQEKQEV